MKGTSHPMRLAGWAALSLLPWLATVAPAEDPVHFNDANLKAAVGAALGKADPTPSDMLALASLYVENEGLSDLTGLESATRLTYLWIDNNLIGDLSPLAGLKNLAWLDLSGNRISDLSPLAGLVDLTTLVLDGNQISDISPLAGLTDLATLWIQNNRLTDISALASLTKLTALYLEENQISDVSALAALSNLGCLTLQSNRISDISPLAGLHDLSVLDLSVNQISDISPLAHLAQLRSLNLDENQISDITALQGLTHLKWLYLQSNPLNAQACDVFIPQVVANNAGVTILHDPCHYVYSLTISSSPGGSVTDPGEGFFEYDSGTAVVVIAWAEPGYQFTEWTGTAVEVGKIADATSSSSTVTVDHDYTLQAHFVSNEHTLTIACQGDGTVETSVVFAGVSTTLTGEGSFVLDHNSQLTITATPEAGWRFTGWSGPIGTHDPVLTITLTEDVTLTASVARNPHTLDVTCGAGGQVVQPGVGSFALEAGSKVPIEAAADAGCRFTGWTGTAVDNGYVTDPAKSATEVTLTDDCTLQANFEEVTRPFHEGWETARLGIYTPSKSAAVEADEGPWATGDDVSTSGTCGSTLNRAQVLTLESGQALLLSSKDSKSACSDAVWVALDEPATPAEGIVVDANTVLSFNEVGRLDAPALYGSGEGCENPPCFDNVSLRLTDNRGNTLAYVLQRPSDAVANAPNTHLGDTYREVFLDPSGVFYQRNLLSDFGTIPAFNPADARISTIEFRVAEHGSAVIDDITIAPGPASEKIPVYRFWSPVLESHLFTVGADEKQFLIDVWQSVWTFEGISYFTLPEGSDPNLTPAYRFWSPTLSSHLYTIDESERDNLISQFPDVWTLEGIAFYVFPEGRQPMDACPVYRFWSASLGYHFYTAREEERDDLMRNHSDVWTYEGAAWYAYPPNWDSKQALEIVGDN
jgi:Leucine-rich repeat (LRR) protein